MNIYDLFAEIAPPRALQIKPEHYAEGVLTLAASLEPNLNDKGPGFAGSIASLLMLSAWGTIALRLFPGVNECAVMNASGAIIT